MAEIFNDSFDAGEWRFVTIDAICYRTNACRRSVIRWLNALVEGGYLKRQRCEWSASMYQFTDLVFQQWVELPEDVRHLRTQGGHGRVDMASFRCDSMSHNLEGSGKFVRPGNDPDDLPCDRVTYLPDPDFDRDEEGFLVMMENRAREEGGNGVVVDEPDLGVVREGLGENAARGALLATRRQVDVLALLASLDLAGWPVIGRGQRPAGVDPVDVLVRRMERRSR